MFEQEQHQTTATQHFVERIVRTLCPQRGADFEAMFDFNDWILGRSLTREAYAACMDGKHCCEGSAGLQYLFTYLSELHTAYTLWSARAQLSDDEQEIANQRLTGIAKLKDLVCMAAN